jgi:mono/diheme cytochrome c family protein
MKLVMTSIPLMLIAVTTIVLGQARPQKPGSALANAPTKMRERQNPFANSESARVAGRKLFMRHCAECHGATAEGSVHAPSLLAIAGAATPGTLHWFIKNGNLRRGMPSWSRLPDQQLWQVVTYLKTLTD